MSAERKPQVGEVWTNEAGEPWECLKVLTSGTYVWFAYGTVGIGRVSGQWVPCDGKRVLA